MSAFDGEDKREIIIVKRRGDDHDDGHHGGVWKIAFADFMTALMCLFLVMWLIAAANEQTKASIASYFNPMTLVDAAPTSEGIDDPGQSPQSRDNSDSEEQKAAEEPINEMEERSGPGQHANSVDQAESEQTSDQYLFSDPYAVLAEIAAQTATLQNVSAKGDGGAQTSGPATGAQGGESYRDPFAPDFWSQEVARVDDEELDVFREVKEEQPEPAPEIVVETPAEAAQPAEEALPPLPEEPAAETATAAPGKAAEEQTEPEAAEEPAVTGETQQLASEIREEIVEAFGQDSELNSTISVTAESDGILISVTDELNYGMFEIGSAVPQGELVRAMAQIGAALNQHPGKIRINGHTDGRPFKGGEYDNWRLSTARAHSAYYMLVRGGVDEARVEQVAGFADRDLKVPGNPLADANRRIEIFLETGG